MAISGGAIGPGFCQYSSYSSWGPSKLRQYYNFKNIQIHSQHIKCVPSGHYSTTTYCIYNTIYMCPCVYSAYVIVCLYACVCAYVCVASQSPLFHKLYFLSIF